VDLVRTDVSEELNAFFIRVTRIDELGTTFAITSNRRTLRRNTLLTFQKHWIIKVETLQIKPLSKFELNIAVQFGSLHILKHSISFEMQRVFTLDFWILSIVRYYKHYKIPFRDLICFRPQVTLERRLLCLFCWARQTGVMSF
jgi:enoyl-[acyl-carrier-protein] reductase (NADH)